jgi:hypothetical protein
MPTSCIDVRPVMASVCSARVDDYSNEFVLPAIIFFWPFTLVIFLFFLFFFFFLLAFRFLFLV